VGWCGPEPEHSEGDYTARVFCPQGLALTARGPQAPTSKQQSQPKAVIDKKGRRNRSGATVIRQSRDRSKVAPVSGTSNILQANLATRLRERKVGPIEKLRPDVILLVS
jgi:hypothetical protein